MSQLATIQKTSVALRTKTNSPSNIDITVDNKILFKDGCEDENIFNI